MTTMAAPTIGPEQGAAAARNHHQQRFGRGGQRHHLRADELVVVEEQQARDAGPETREHDGEIADQPDVVAECGHAPGLVARAGKADAERRAREDRHGRDSDQEHEQRGVVEGRCTAQADAERCRPRRHVDAVVAVGQARPAVGDAPQDLADRQRDHEEADAGGAQGEHGKDFRHGDRVTDERGDTGRQVVMPGSQQHAPRHSPPSQTGRRGPATSGRRSRPGR